MIKDMLTAAKISMQTGIQIHTVRYRLTELRRTKKTEFKQVGTTYVYPESTAKLVGEFGNVKSNAGKK